MKTMKNTTKKYLLVLWAFVTGVCGIAMFSGALNYASAIHESFYWVASLIAIVGLGFCFGKVVKEEYKRLDD